MQIKSKFLVTNIRRYLDSDNPKLTEDSLIHEISIFSCPKNPDVEHFLKKNAIEFTKKSQSVTYLVFSLNSMNMVGYFTIALKSLTIRGEMISNTVKRKLLRISELDEKSGTYTMSSYLIAQLGKNYLDNRNSEITGSELVELAWTVIKEIQYMGGGMITFVETENKEKLLSFYRNNRFSQFDTRQTSSGTDEPHQLLQLLRLL